MLIRKELTKTKKSLHELESSLSIIEEKIKISQQLQMDTSCTIESLQKKMKDTQNVVQKAKSVLYQTNKNTENKNEERLRYKRKSPLDQSSVRTQIKKRNSLF